MQVSTLCAHWGLGSELHDQYRDGTSAAYGQLFIDLSTGTDFRLRYYTNTGFIPSKFYIPDRLKQSKLLEDEHTNSLSSKCSNIFPANTKFFSFSLVQKSFTGLHSKNSQKKPAKQKKTSRDKVSKEKNHLEAKKRSGIPKGATTSKIFYSSLINHFS